MLNAILSTALLVGPSLQEPETVDLRAWIEVYRADGAALRRRYAAPLSHARLARLSDFERNTLAALDELPFETFDVEQRIDWLLLSNDVRAAIDDLEVETRRLNELWPLVDFAEPLVALIEAREAVDPVDPDATAASIASVVEEIDAASARLESGEHDGLGATIGSRAVRALRDLERAIAEWYGFRADYDPLFTWWLEAPVEELSEGLRTYRDAVAGRLVDSDDSTLVADPLGREALVAAIEREFLPYGPEELIEIAEAELERCDALMLEASRELGFGEDWRAAQEHVRTLHVEPGEQPGLIADMVREAIGFVTERDLLTVPPLAAETWRMTMLSPERQRIAPYFLGGEEIQVAFPTATMDDADKRATLAGNNVHFSRAVVHHEVIPGHHLQQFIQARHRPYRRSFSTPFWVEGWALYWELRLWELDFARGPEDRIGMLFWRKHRCARIIFSLSIQLGEMTGPEAVDYLVERVGHRRRNAEAEVRRSVGGLYPPLYQAAYMLGGLQLRSLHHELVEQGDWSEREFHDAVLHQNAIPIELVRAALRGDRLPRDFESSWRFSEN